MRVHGVMNPTVSIYRICARGSTPDFDSVGARARCGACSDRPPWVRTSRFTWTASLADPSAGRGRLRFDRTTRGVIMNARPTRKKEEGRKKKEKGKRKKEKAAVTLTSVTSATGLSKDSNGNGLPRRAENRRRRRPRISRTYPVPEGRRKKEEGRRKKEKAAVNLISVTSATGLSKDSNGNGLARRSEYRRRCRLPFPSPRFCRLGGNPPGSEGILPSVADSRGPGVVISDLVSEGREAIGRLLFKLVGCSKYEGRDALAPDIGRSCRGLSPSLPVGERAGERGRRGWEGLLILPFVFDPGFGFRSLFLADG